MAIGTLISVEEYLSTSYDPDVEYVDGVLVERNVGDWLHSLVQRNVVVALSVKYPNIKAVPEFRERTAERRFRVPDVTVLLHAPVSTKALMEPPFIAIEILSPDDTMTRVLEKLQEYAANQTPHIWLFDPRLRQMFTFQANALQEIKADVIATETPRLELTREEVFRD